MAVAARKAEEASDKRERLLAAALDLFEARGFDAVAVPEIALKAGVATGTVYRYFATKEALVNALYRQWKQAYNDAVLAPVVDGATAREIFAAYWRRMMVFTRANPRAIRFMELHHHAPYLDAQSRAEGQRYAKAARDFVSAARAAGAIRELDPALVVALTWGAAAGLLKFEQSGALRLDEQTATQMEEALWRAIANPLATQTEDEKGQSHGTQTQGRGADGSGHGLKHGYRTRSGRMLR
ncbi:MAG TPA: TetR/AcrR family transcriptional regulator [Rhizomicrobium sp.]|nr:TetR/AcrR family transcriptional regulator [Rhizomicrobium sp.]